MVGQLWRGVLVGALAVAGVSMSAQRRPEAPDRRGGGWMWGAPEQAPYDGRFAFVRMSYDLGLSGFGRRGDAPWAHDYPDGERNFLEILSTVTSIDVNLDQSSVIAFDDDQMFRSPIIYLVEPGYWNPSDEQVMALRAYLEKGGFLIVDDFPFRAWPNFEQQMARVFPRAEWRELAVEHAIFHSFFDIQTLDIVPAYPALGDRPIFLALFEDNDPDARMQVIANYQNDLSEFWEVSPTGYYPIAETNEAYKVGVNQFVYGMMH